MLKSDGRIRSEVLSAGDISVSEGVGVDEWLRANDAVRCTVVVKPVDGADCMS